MIRYSLKCENGHSFESWFKSAEAYDTLRASGMVACPTCQSQSIEKTLMAPQVSPARNKAAVPAKPEGQVMASGPDPKLADAIEKIRDHVETNSEYVGDKFAEQARAMHEGDAPERSIYGEVPREEAKKLIDDGVPALPLPFIPKQKTN